MQLSQYNYLENIPKYPEASKGYRYEIYTAAKEDFDTYTGRWKDENQRIKDIAERLLKREDWEELLTGGPNIKPLPQLRQGLGGVQINGTVCPYIRDLGGLHFKGYSPKEEDEILHYVWLDYCHFELCNFTSDSHEVLATPLFYNSIIKHTRFERCIFMNNHFSFGEFKFCVFSNCHFENFVFNRLPRGEFNYIIFVDCYFRSVDFRRMDLKNICFSGKCTFENIQVNKEELSQYSKHIGEEVTNKLKKWDREAYYARQRSIEYIHPNLLKKKYQAVLDAYWGTSAFYRTISLMEELDGFHKNYMDWQYLYYWTNGEGRRLSSDLGTRFREFVSRNLIGYGAKPMRPMIAWLVLNVVFSWMYLIFGIKYDGNIIQHKIGVDRSQLWTTIKHYGLCLYYSMITSTTVGYGDISPMPGVSMLLCAVHAVLGLLLITMFTVIFARRFFK